MTDKIFVDYFLNSDEEFPWILQGIIFKIDEDTEQQTLRLLLAHDLTLYQKEAHLWLLWDAMEKIIPRANKSLSARFDLEYEIVEAEIVISVSIGDAPFIYSGEVINKRIHSYPEDFLPMTRDDVVRIETYIDAEQEVRCNVDFSLIGCLDTYEVLDIDKADDLETDLLFSFPDTEIELLEYSY